MSNTNVNKTILLLSVNNKSKLFVNEHHATFIEVVSHTVVL